jgi:hypothetical protein
MQRLVHVVLRGVGDDRRVAARVGTEDVRLEGGPVAGIAVTAAGFVDGRFGRSRRTVATKHRVVI